MFIKKKETIILNNTFSGLETIGKDILLGIEYKKEIKEINLESIIKNLLLAKEKKVNKLYNLIKLQLKLYYNLKIYPKFIDLYSAKENISPFQKYFFTNSKDKEYEDLEKLLKHIKDVLLELKEYRKEEYIENFIQSLLIYSFNYLKILVFTSREDKTFFFKYQKFFVDISFNYMKEFKNNDEVGIAFRETVYLFLIHENSLSFIHKVLYNENSDFKFSFENSFINENLIQFIFDENERAKIYFKNKEFLELYLSEYDKFSNSIQQSLNDKQLNLVLEKLNVIFDNPKNLLDDIDLKTNYDLIGNKLIDINIELSNISKSKFNFSNSLIVPFKFIENIINESLQKENNKFTFQIVIFKSDLVRDFINIIYYFDLNFLEINEIQKEIIRNIKKIIFNCLFKLIEGNSFLVTLFFCEEMYEKLLNRDFSHIDNINFYSKLLLELKSLNIKIDIRNLAKKISFVKIEGLFPPVDETIAAKFTNNTKIIDLNKIPEETILNILKFEPQIISDYITAFNGLIKCSNENSILLINQICVENLIFLNYVQNFNLEEEKDNEKKVIYYKNILILMNKLESTFFQRVMFLFDIKVIEEIINDIIHDTKKFPNYRNLLFLKEIILFYSKYHFQSITYWSEFKLMNTSLRIIEKEKIDFFLEYLQQIHILMFDLNIEIDKDENENSDLKKMHQLFSFICKGICIPVYLILWKITYYTYLTGEEKYEIYSLVFLFLNVYKEILVKIIEIKNKNELIKQNFDILVKKYYIENTNIDSIKNLLEEKIDNYCSGDKKIDILNVKNWVKEFIVEIKPFTFYNKIKDYYEKIDLEVEENEEKIKKEDEINKKNKEEENENKKINKDIFNKMNELYQQYKSDKMNNQKNFVMKFFDEGEEKNNMNKTISIFKSIIYNYNVSMNYSEIKPVNYTFKFDQMEKEEKIIEEIDENDEIKLEINEEEKEFQDNKTKIGLDNKMKFQNNFMLYSNAVIIEIAQRVFFHNPKYFQSLLVKFYEFSKSILIPLITYQIYYLIQTFLFSIGEIFIIRKENLNILINSLDFLRLLCEDHNPLFQTIFFGNYITRALKQHFNFIKLIFQSSTQIIKIFTHYQKQKFFIDTLSFNTPYNYLTELEEELNEFKIELFQGTTQQNLQQIQKNNYFVNFIEAYFKFSDYFLLDEMFALLISNFMKFINSFINECFIFSKTDISGIISYLPILKLLSKGESSFTYLMIKFPIKVNGVVQNFSIYKDNIKKSIDRKELTRKYNLLQDLLFEHFDELTKSSYFNICFQIFVHLIQISQSDQEKRTYYKKNLEDLNNVNKFSETGFGPDSVFIGKLYYDFCIGLIVKNEVVFYKEIKQWKGLGETYMKLIPDEGNIYGTSIDIRSSTKLIDDKGKPNLRMNFLNEIDDILTPPSDNNNGSHILIYYLRNKETLLISRKDVYKFLANTDFKDCYSKLINIIYYYDELNNIIKMRVKYRNNPNILALLELDFNEFEYYNVVLLMIPNFLLIFSSPGSFIESFIFYYEIFQLLFVCFIIVDFLYFKYIKLRDVIKKEDLSIFDIIENLKSKEIFSFVWTFIFGLLGLKYNFLLSCQLFILFTISQTMNSVLQAIQNRYKQFFASAFLLIILSLFYGALTLYFFNVMDDGTVICNSYLECFLYIFNSGLRNGGLPFAIKISEQKGFYGELIYSWIFYFFIILIILNIFNGIIVDTFQEIRENNEKFNDEILNTCYICQLKTSDFEGEEFTFEEHIIYEHNIFHYFFYLFKIHNTDAHDLNSVDFQVYNYIKNDKIVFFPINKEEEED